MTFVTRIGGLIEAFRPADGPPPQKLGAFFRWCLSGSWPMLWIAGVLSAIAGAMEVVSALFLGWVIDAAIASGAEVFFSQQLWLLVAFVGF